MGQPGFTELQKAELWRRWRSGEGDSEIGRIMEGASADLLLFDPLTVGRSRKRRVSDLPADAPRLITDPIGASGRGLGNT